MPRPKVVVDGSNLATEGRALPSLAQLDEAVRAFVAENPDHEVIVVVDASFGYRIDEVERRTFEEAELAGEIVSPPAGALGRGDGFLLQIADRTGAIVLSNDSFQEFHGEYEWLFEKGRLIGGKPVPGVGWFFTPRSPVRGPRSRVAVNAAKRTRAGASVKEPSSVPAKAAKAAEPVPSAKSRRVAKAIAEATADALVPAARHRRRRGRSRRSQGPSEPVNEPLPFITFIADHGLGSEVEGTVDSFTSHGAFVMVGSARCYVPLIGLGDPPPRRAREILRKGDVRTFVVQALDPPRRGIEVALPGLARVAGTPTDETVKAEISEGSPRPEPKAKPKVKPGPEAATKAMAATKKAAAATKKAAAATKKAAVAKKTGPAKKVGAAKKPAPAKKAPATKKDGTARRPAPAKTAAAEKDAAKKETGAKKKASAKKAAVAKTTPGSAEQAPATKPATAKKAAPKKAAKTASKSAQPERSSPSRGA